ncbi:MAG: fructose-bisphosphatase class III [Lachnospiraceae bacterium]|nr:fructose-bisphosphatase class III [Lachnospiraceae bacterium]
MVYCVSDIHGDYEGYKKLMDKIKLRDEDTLYVIGDVVDRGPGSIKILQDMMLHHNIIPIIGNHEYMAINCLKFLSKEITYESISCLDSGMLQGLAEWQNVGGQATIDEFYKISPEEKADIIEYLEEFSLYEEISVEGKDYVLVHAGLSNFAPDRPLIDYHISEMIFMRPYYDRVYYEDKYLVTGHLPTRNIEANGYQDKIYKANNHIAIDCGSGYGGRLGCICLDTWEEFYV